MLLNDENLYEKIFQSTYWKLVFQNDVDDFEKKELMHFSPEYFFQFKALKSWKETRLWKKWCIRSMIVFGDPEVNKDGTLNYSENKDEKALYYKKNLVRAVIYDLVFHRHW